MEENMTPEHVPATPTGPKNLLLQRNFALLLFGQSFSRFGDIILIYTLMVWLVAKVALGQPWAPLAISAMMFSTFVPYIVIGPWAGVLVDHWSHRRTMLTMDACRTVLIGLLILSTGAVPLPWHLPPFFLISVVCVEAFLESTGAQFFNPASKGLLGQVVVKEDLARASGLQQTFNSAARLIGPLLGPILYFAVGIFWGLLIQMLSFVVSWLTLYAIRVPQTEEPVQQAPAEARPGFWREFAAGLGFATKERVIRTLIVTSVITMLGGGALDALMIFFLQRNLQAPLAWLGVLSMAVALGLIGGGLFFGHFGERVGLKRLLGLTLLCMGVLFMVLSRLTNFWLALLVLLFLGSLLAGNSVAENALLVGETPKKLIGRVAAVSGSLAMLSNTVSVILGGYLVSVTLLTLNWHVLGTTFKAVDAVYMGAGILVFLAGLYALVALRGASGKKPVATEGEPQEVVAIEV